MVYCQNNHILRWACYFPLNVLITFVICPMLSFFSLVISLASCKPCGKSPTAWPNVQRTQLVIAPNPSRQSASKPGTGDWDVVGVSMRTRRKGRRKPQTPDNLHISGSQIK